MLLRLILPQNLRKRKGKTGLWYKRRNPGKSGSPKGTNMHWVKYSPKRDKKIVSQKSRTPGNKNKHTGDLKTMKSFRI